MWSEISGVVARDRLSPTQLDAAERMLALGGASDVLRIDLPWAVVAARVWRGSAAHASLNRGQAHALFAGQLTAGEPQLDLPALVAALRVGERSAWPERGAARAGCVLDEETHSAWLVADHAGLVPLFVADLGDTFAFASRPGPLLRAGLVPRALDPAGVIDLLTFEYVTGDRTLHRGLDLLPADGLLHCGPGGLRITRGAASLPPVVAEGLHDFVDRLHAVLGSAVARMVARQQRVGITLSGGMDSRALLGYALGRDVPIRTYTFGLAGSRDAEFARRIADRAGVTNSFLPIDGSFLPRWIDHAVETTGGMVGATHFHILCLLDQIAGECSVVLDGLSGDMLAGSHVRWSMLRPMAPERAARRAFAAHAHGLRGERISRLLRPEFVRGAEHDPRQAVAAYFSVDRPHWRSAWQYDVHERQRRFIQYGPHLYRHAVDVATPFYDRDVLELFRGAPLSMLLEQRAYLHLHARHLRKLAVVPDAARGLPLSWPLPVRFGKRVADWAWRRLPGGIRRHRPPPPPTTDYPQWLRTSCRPLLEQRLLDDRSALDEVVVPAELERLVREHLVGEHDHTTTLGCLLSLSTWCRSLS
jgi:asparagine synthase (glutamine-hydrolysing)